MSDQTSQDFLRELDKKLWTAADRLRSNLDAAVYALAKRGRSRRIGTQRGDVGVFINYAVLGLICFKCASDSADAVECISLSF